jgi:hypothetical protein
LRALCALYDLPMYIPRLGFTIMPQQPEVVAALTFDFTDQIDPQSVMVFHYHGSY